MKRYQQPNGIPLPYLRAWRRYRLISQDELALDAGMSKASICLLETGKRAASFRTIARLSGALGLTRAQLVRQRPPTDPEVAADISDD